MNSFLVLPDLTFLSVWHCQSLFPQFPLPLSALHVLLVLSPFSGCEFLFFYMHLFFHISPLEMDFPRFPHRNSFSLTLLTLCGRSYPYAWHPLHNDSQVPISKSPYLPELQAHVPSWGCHTSNTIHLKLESQNALPFSFGISMNGTNIHLVVQAKLELSLSPSFLSFPTSS